MLSDLQVLRELVPGREPARRFLLRAAQSAAAVPQRLEGKAVGSILLPLGKFTIVTRFCNFIRQNRSEFKKTMSCLQTLKCSLSWFGTKYFQIFVGTCFFASFCYRRVARLLKNLRIAGVRDDVP